MNRRWQVTCLHRVRHCHTQAVTVRSEAGAEVTILQRPGHIVQWVSGEGPDSILDGFTLTGPGAALLSARNGTSPVIRNCVVTNTVLNGMEVESGANPLLEDCLFLQGNAIGLTVNDSTSSVTFIGCEFIENGGSAIQTAGSVVVVACRFVGNASSGGSGMLFIQGGGLVANCVFEANGASPTETVGGAFNITGRANPLIVNCTMVNNHGFGGAMFCDNFATPVVVGCIIRDNDLIQIFDDLAITTVLYTNIENGWDGVGSNNIDADPLFVDPGNGNFRLQAGSPCIDAGHNWAIAGRADTDLDGNPRFAADKIDFDPGCGIPVVVDMGAYEYQGDPFPVKFGDINGDGVVGINDFLGLLAAWGPCPKDCCLADLDIDGDVGIADFLLLLGNWG